MHTKENRKATECIKLDEGSGNMFYFDPVEVKEQLNRQVDYPTEHEDYLYMGGLLKKVMPTTAGKDQKTWLRSCYRIVKGQVDDIADLIRPCRKLDKRGIEYKIFLTKLGQYSLCVTK